jgi:cyanophycinase
MKPTSHTPPRLTAILAVSLSLAAPCASAVGQTPGEAVTGEGRLVIVGGALAADNAEVYHAVLEAREGDGPLCIVPTASGVPEESMASSIERFSAYASDARYGPGAPEVIGVWITTENPEAARDPETVAQLAGCSGYWFVGGQQARIVSTFRPSEGDTPAYEALMRRWREGAVVSGTSAGAAMMSSRSIGGGSPAEAFRAGVTRDGDADGVWVMRGMDFVPWAILGQHHMARGRWGRLVVATLEEEDWLGLGIDENTALMYEDGVGTVIGASGVLVVDVSDATAGTDPRTAIGIRLELLAAGDRIDVRTGAVARSALGKGTPPALPLDEAAAEPFARWAFLRILQGFASGEVRRFIADADTHTLRLRRGVGFAGVASTDETAVLEEAGTRAGLSVGPLVLDISR